MADLFLEDGADFVLNAAGDLVIATDWDEVRQRIERRIFTNPQTTQTGGEPIEPEYIFHTDYGLGAEAVIGDTWNQNAINSFRDKIIKGVIQDQGVNGAVMPSVQVNPISGHEVEFQIQVTLVNGLQNTITLSVP
jgi:hypothetical protein